ncbi:MAG: LysM peptidoglycan-binding domain-containing protein, partial [Verrucomicrobia bacterium]|nr:LysM peptidoglycan-binding domain-containing protein [Verrucomicrobiota bacterium]
MNRRRWIGGWVSVLMVVGVWCSWAEDDATQRDSFVYTVGAGQTVKDIAERFLGDASCAPELLKYNSISNPLEVVEGSMLIIPGARREKARTAFAEAESVLSEAEQKQCRTYAPLVYARAGKTFRLAQDAWQDTSYLRAEGLCLLAAEQARLAIQKTEENARVDREATLVALHGNVQVMHKGTWAKAKLNGTVPVTGRIKTAPDARAKVMLPGGSTMRVGGATDVRIEELMEDRRSGTLRTRLRVLLGEITTEAKKLPTEQSRHEVLSGEATTAIRGTVFSVAHNQNVTRVVTYEGEVMTAAGGREVVIPEGAGTVIQQGRGPNAALAIPDPPEALQPQGDRFKTAAQRVAFVWEAAGKPTLERRQKLRHSPIKRLADLGYRLEIAGDPEFVKLVQEVRTEGTRATSDLLTPGDYYWRLASVNAQGLRGAWSRTRELSVVRDLGVSLVAEPALIQHGKQLLAAAGVRLHLKPTGSSSSVHSAEYKVNAAAYAAAAGGVRLVEAGDYRVSARGVGEDRVAGKPTELRFRLDSEPPRVGIDLGLPERDADGKLVVKAVAKAADDIAVKTILVSLDGAPMFVYESPVVLDATREYILAVQAVDVAGNRSRVRK